MSEASETSEHAPEGHSHQPQASTELGNNIPAAYTKQLVTKDLHPAFVDSGLNYDATSDSFVAEANDLHNEAALFDSQRAFAEALARFQDGVKSKYKSEIDLGATHDWDEVMKHVEKARNRYTGEGKDGIKKILNSRLKTFQTAAPAVQAWLKLLPSTSIYGSVVCGGLTIILEAAVRLRQLRKETLDALDHIPLCIENAQILIRTHGYTQVDQYTVNLYSAIIEALHHILAWYERAAGMKFISAFSKGTAYAKVIKDKMKNVEKASQAMKERAEQLKHLRLEDIRGIVMHTKDQVEDLKILAVEARNHLYEIFKDTEVWQQAALEAWRKSEAPQGSAVVHREDQDLAARKSLLALFKQDHIDQSRDVEKVLTQITSMTLGDQDRVAAIVNHRAVTNWLLDTQSAALMIQGNGRRHDAIAPTSIACALLIHVFSKKLHFPTLYWFCGLHRSRSTGNLISMLKNLMCQLLSLSCCVCTEEDQIILDTEDFAQLLKGFMRLVRRSSSGTPVVCILDGISFYETRHQREELGNLVDALARLAKSHSSALLLLLTSPLRANYIAQRPNKTQDLMVAEIPIHVTGTKQGFGSHQLRSLEEIVARVNLENRPQHR
ncbi:MAG: hypothetical protein Q9168_002280 [Polycauliona sp. 1 TL-2023]